VRGDPSADQVPDTASSEVVHDTPGETELPARPSPQLSEVLYRSALPMEDERTVEPPCFPTPIEDRGELAPVNRENPAVAVLAPLGTKPEHALGSIVITPFEGAYFTNAPG